MVEEVEECHEMMRQRSLAQVILRTPGNDMGTRGLDEQYAQPGFNHGNFEAIQVQCVSDDSDELDTVSIVGPFWFILDALDKSRQGKPGREAEKKGSVSSAVR